MPRNIQRRTKRAGRTPSRNSRTSSRNLVRTIATRDVPPSWDPAIVDSMPMMMPRRPQISTFRRTYTVATLTANTGDTLRAFNATLSALPNSTDFTSLYDQYRILEVAYTFTPYATSSASNTVSTGFPGIIGTWLDYDDSNLPANLQEGQQYDTFQRNTATLPFVRIVKPRSAVAAYSGAFTSYQNVYGQWIDATSPSVQFYGLKLVITGSSYATVTNIYEVEATVTVQVRSQH